MGHAQWRLHNSKKPVGQLDRVKYVIPVDDECEADYYYYQGENPPHLSACSVRMPERIGTRTAIAAASRNLAGAKTRSLELWWDAAQNNMSIVLVAADCKDLAAYTQEFSRMYPDAEFDAMSGAPIPDWFDPAEAYHMFDAETRHGHYAATFDKNPPSTIISTAADGLRTSQNVWMQFTFRLYNFGNFLNLHLSHIRAKRSELESYGSSATAAKPRTHPEAGYDFDDNSLGLSDHALNKEEHPPVMMSIRGLVRAAHPRFDLSFDYIRSNPIEYHTSKYEHLTRCTYENFWNPARPQTVQITDSDIRYPRISMFERRLLPDPQEFLEPALNKYFKKNWLGKYRDRDPLPFLILNQNEMPGFVRLPDSHFIPNMGAVLGSGDMHRLLEPDLEGGGPWLLRL